MRNAFLFINEQNDQKGYKKLKIFKIQNIYFKMQFS
ncbi:hypothetical protein BARD7_00728 [Bacillus amyloliquefaciens]|nr:hypothetical protein BARD7_00728 [Bacillus amyloliquefaciens]